MTVTSDQVEATPQAQEPKATAKKSSRRKKADPAIVSKVSPDGLPDQPDNDSDAALEDTASPVAIPVSRLKATCRQSLLAKYGQIAIKAVALQPTSDLQYLKISAHLDSQTLELSSFDQSKGITTSIPATVEESGTLLCRPQEFSSLVQKLPDTAISLIGGLTAITLLTGISRSEVQAKSDVDYPQVPSGIESKCFVLEGAVVQRSILKTIGCVNLDETKGIQNGVNFQLWNTKHGTEIATCATNTQILGLYQTVTAASLRDAPDAEFTVSAKVLRSLIELSGLSATVEIRVSQPESGEPSVIEFHCTEKLDDSIVQTHRFVASLLEGEFVNYRRVLPTVFETEVVLDQALFVGNLERALVIATHKKLKTITLTIDPDTQEVEVFTEAEGIGSHQESLSAQVKGGKMSPLYSCEDLLEIAKQVRSTEIRLRMPSVGQHLLVDSPTQSDFQGMVASKVVV